MKPPAWGKSSLTQYLDTVRDNWFATFHRLPTLFSTLSTTDEDLATAIASEDQPPSFAVPATLMIRALGNFRGGLTLAAAGSIAEAYLAIRSVVECALYCVATASDVELKRIWEARDDSDAGKRAVRQRFKPTSFIQQFVEPQDRGLAGRCSTAYENAITLGAHPNVASINAGKRVRQLDKDRQHVELELLSADRSRIAATLKDLNDAGIIAIDVWKIALRKRHAG